MSEFIPYKTYEEIPVLVSEYVLTVADKKHIMSIPLNEINEFLRDLTEYLNQKVEEELEGWV